MKLREKMFLWLSIFTVVIFAASIIWAADTYEFKGGTAANIDHPRAKAGLNFIKLMEAKSGGKDKGEMVSECPVGGRGGTLKSAQQ